MTLRHTKSPKSAAEGQQHICKSPFFHSCVISHSCSTSQMYKQHIPKSCGVVLRFAIKQQALSVAASSATVFKMLSSILVLPALILAKQVCCVTMPSIPCCAAKLVYRPHSGSWLKWCAVKG